MITIRNFTIQDIPNMQEDYYMHKTHSELEKMINDMNTKTCDGRYFEAFAIVVNDHVVGYVSLYEQSKETVSCGVLIYPSYRRKGYAFEGMSLVIKESKHKGYNAIIAHVRTDNVESICLHRKLGYEVNKKYINRKGNEVYDFVLYI